MALMIRYGASIKRKAIMKAYDKVCRGGGIGKDTFISDIEKRLRIIKQGFR